MADKGVGKTTLVKKLLENRKNDVCGFLTKRYPELAKDDMCPVYISGINEDPVTDDKHLLGTCGGGRHYTNNEVFNELGVELITADNKNSLIIMDELGFLEMNAEKFKEKVFEVLESENPVLIMLKQRLDIEFLKKIKDNPNVEFIRMDVSNRDEICEYILTELGI